MTLGDYRKMAVCLFPGAVGFLDKKIEEQGEGEEVLESEEQMIQLLYQMDQAAALHTDTEGGGDG